MAGIVSYGGYLPRHRLPRMTVVQNMAWFNPVLFAVAKGERAVANWDEDSITMAVSASYDCCAGMDGKNINALYFATTTPAFLDRQNAGIVANALNLPEEGVRTSDFTGSLKSGTGALIAACDAAQSGESSAVLVAAADNRMAKSATMYEMFLGDAGAAILVGNDDVIAEYLGSYSIQHDLVDHYRAPDKKFDYTWEERWVRDEGYAKIIPQAVAGFMDKHSLNLDDVSHFVYPCYYNREHGNIAKKLGLPKEKVQDNLHDECGDTGSAHPLLMLNPVLDRANPGEIIIVAGFGQGCDVLGFRVTDAIKKISRPRGFTVSLQHKIEIVSYTKYLKFRDMITADMGIRGESVKNTPLTALWRHRKMLLGMTGTRCRACGTVQFPPSPMCVNPECNAVNDMEDYHFPGKTARVFMYTGDMLSASIDPPAVYGLVEFEGGGRTMLDFTDCQLDNISVGMELDLSFRRRYRDDTRGFSGYFWKAVPRAG